MIILHKKTVNSLLELDKKGKLPHGFIFFGAPGIGKTEGAVWLARSLEEKEIKKSDKNESRPLSDMKLVHSEAGSAIGIDEVRDIQDFLSKRPSISTRRTIIIADAPKLTHEAQNALLKTAEEPPEGALIILIARDPDMLWSTLASRLQKIYFPNVPDKDAKDYLIKKKGFAESKAQKYLKVFPGAPILAIKMDEDEEFKRRAGLAKEFLEISPGKRKDFLKRLTEAEEFSLTLFLDSLILALSARGAFKYSKLWHSVVDLRGLCDITNPSPKIQLNYLWTLL